MKTALQQHIERLESIDRTMFLTIESDMIDMCINTAKSMIIIERTQIQSAFEAGRKEDDVNGFEYYYTTYEANPSTLHHTSGQAIH